MLNFIKKMKNIFNPGRNQVEEKQLCILGKKQSEHNTTIDQINNLNQVEFRVFSQFEDDGIIQWLVNKIDIPNKTYIEFGVGDYLESNTRFLMINNNWSGYVLDESEKNTHNIKNYNWFWKYDLKAEYSFITKENINELMIKSEFQEDLGLLSIDVDGNDYWIWKNINTFSPIILIIEYNSVFGKDNSWTIPYEQNFNRTKAHFSNLYFGASLKALVDLAKEKGYCFIGSNSAGNNAYFIRRDKMNHKLNEVDCENGFKESKFRESLDQNGQLNFMSGSERLKSLKGLPIFNTSTGELEKI